MLVFGAGPLHPGETPETMRYRARSWDGAHVFHDDWATSPPTSRTVSCGTSLTVQPAQIHIFACRGSGTPSGQSRSKLASGRWASQK